MSIEDEAVVDFIGVDDATDEAVLTVSDHLPWDNLEHQYMLQEKLNTYLAFIESGELVQEYPRSRGKNVRIRVVCKYQPDSTGIAFLKKCAEIVEEAGFGFQFEKIDAGT